MIDPDGIQVQEINLPSNINIQSVPEFEFEVYSLEDEKDYKKYLKDIENSVRRSFEYKQYIKYIRENMNMDKCAFLNGVSNDETFDIKIEIHHYPFSLFDICEIIYRKRKYYNESLDVQMVAKEVMSLHYKLVIGLIPLAETVHELTHNGRLFVPVDKVMGRYNLFVDYYKPFCEPGQLETLERIERYSKEQQNEILSTRILEENKISFNITSPAYQLPQFNTITNNMIEQIDNIKNNNYILPNVQEKELLEDHNLNNKKVISPVSWDMSLKKCNDVEL